MSNKVISVVKDFPAVINAHKYAEYQLSYYRKMISIQGRNFVGECRPNEPSSSRASTAK